MLERSFKMNRWAGQLLFCLLLIFLLMSCVAEEESNKAVRITASEEKVGKDLKSSAPDCIESIDCTPTEKPDDGDGEEPGGDNCVLFAAEYEDGEVRVAFKCQDVVHEDYATASSQGMSRQWTKYFDAGSSRRASNGAKDTFTDDSGLVAIEFDDNDLAAGCSQYKFHVKGVLDYAGELCFTEKIGNGNFLDPRYEDYADDSK